MTSVVCLDTNTYVAFLEADKKIVEYIKKADEIILPFIVLGELYYGFYRGTNASENIANLDKFISSTRVTIVNATEQTALIFGEIAAELANIGKPMQQNDIWIAAISKQLNCSLLTYDKVFKNVIGLKLAPILVP